MVINSVFILLRITTIMRKKQWTMLLWGYLLPLQTLFWLNPPKNRNSFGLWETCQKAWRPPKKNPPEAPDLILDLNDHWGTPQKNHCWTQKSCGLWLADIKRSKTSPSHNLIIGVCGMLHLEAQVLGTPVTNFVGPLLAEAPHYMSWHRRRFHTTCQTVQEIAQAVGDTVVGHKDPEAWTRGKSLRPYEPPLSFHAGCRG